MKRSTLIPGKTYSFTLNRETVEAIFICHNFLWYDRYGQFLGKGMCFCSYYKDYKNREHLSIYVLHKNTIKQEILNVYDVKTVELIQKLFQHYMAIRLTVSNFIEITDNNKHLAIGRKIYIKDSLIQDSVYEYTFSEIYRSKYNDILFNNSPFGDPITYYCKKYNKVLAYRENEPEFDVNQMFDSKLQFHIHSKNNSNYPYPDLWISNN